MELTIKIDVSAELERLIGGIREALGGVPAMAAGVAAGEREREEPKETEAEAEAPRLEAKALPDDEELRKHMDITISKFAGNGWSQSKDSLTLGIKRMCTDCFKAIARFKGKEKPTQLEGEDRLFFVEQLKHIYAVYEPNDEKKERPSIEWQPF